MEITRRKNNKQILKEDFFLNPLNVFNTVIFGSAILLSPFSVIWIIVFYFVSSCIIFIAKLLLNIANPDAYTSYGFFDKLKKAFFWSYGPQAIASFILLFLSLSTLEYFKDAVLPRSPVKNNINYRLSPNGKIIGKLNKNDVITCQTIIENWCKFPKDGENYYVANWLLKVLPTKK